MNEHFFIYNNQYFRSGVPVISAQNRSFKFGDGLFETMRLHDGKIFNVALHFERLNEAMALLNLHLPSFFSKEYFIDTVNQLSIKNSISFAARIRLTVFHAGENIFDAEEQPANFLIEAFPLPREIQLNEKGLIVDVFPGARKCHDRFSHIKSNNYLASVMAIQFAKKNKIDETLLLNSYNRICESSVANIFIVKGQDIFTPPLSEGCIAGVMRRFLLEKLSFKNFAMKEKELTVEDVLSADELFLTNSIQLVKWVEGFRNKRYENYKVKEIFSYIVDEII